jgi:hypothetical protein
MQANQHLLLQPWILAKRIGSILISGNILNMAFRVSCWPGQTEHLEPWHPDIECRTFDIERNIRYRRLRYRMLVRYRRFLHSISYIDIEGVRYRMSLYSISKLKNRRFRRSRTGLSISKFRLFDIEHNYSISCSASLSDIVYDIEGLFHVRYRI